ncbi:MAG: TetR/AcrR family transcriptional regulator [Clostridiales bacterium]|nr:TetR/AcrR family transcriptional regulator [Clostridiales bacterium]
MDQEKKDKILNAAKKEFIEKGFPYAKVMSICKRAGIPRSAYYRYFDSLEDSLSAVFENMEKGKLLRFRQLVLNNELGFISVSIKILEEMLNDEETYLLMSALSRNNTLDLPMFRNKRQMDFYNTNDEEVAIRNALITVVKGYTEEYYLKKKTKEACLKDYKILIDILKMGKNE